MNSEELLKAAGIHLPSYRSGRQYARCPRCSSGRRKQHQDLKVLGVTIEHDGSVHWGCNHCNWTGPEKGNGAWRAGELTSYVYSDREGAVRFRKVRNVPGREPRFYLQQPDGKGGWKSGTKGVDTSILYRAAEVAKAIGEGRSIYCVEGEKDVDSLWRLGFPATCNAHGASEPGKRAKWTKAHSEQLRGADIVVLNDNDLAGYEHADVTCRLSVGVAKRVRRLDLAPHWPEIPKGGDASDWLATGHTGDELQALIERAPDYAPAQQEAAEQANKAQNGSTDAEIERLARLSALQYEQERKGAAEQLEIRASILDRLVRAEREKLGLDVDDGKQGRAISFPDPELWPEPVDGAALLEDMATAIRKHVVMSDQARDATTLWVLHAYLLDCFLVSPRLAVCSPVKRCGKTTLLDVLARLVLRPLPSANVSAAAVFRVVESCRPTMLIDEADTFLRSEDSDMLRGVLNSGHRKGGAVVRTVGDDHEPRAFGTYSACAIALIGKLPDTLHDRAVVVDLQRRLPGEAVASFRPDRAGHLDELARRAVRWAKDHAETVAGADPEMPQGVFNRAADNWRPLLAIAEAAGGEWPGRARKAAADACGAETGEEGSRLELLLGDIRDIRDSAGDNLPMTEITSADLVARLVGLTTRPWAEYGRSGKPITQNGLARILKPLGITSELLGDGRLHGYRLEHFKEAFDRYLPSKSPPHNRSTAHNPYKPGTSNPFATAHPETERAVAKSQKSPVYTDYERLSGCKGGNGENACVGHTDTQDGYQNTGAGLDAGAGLDTAETLAVCVVCRWPGGNWCAYGDNEPVWLHPECEAAYIEREG
jgi:putative DNA primase/helicase